MRERPHSDFQLALIIGLGGSAALGITPFAIYRFTKGQTAAGSLDAALVVCIVGTVLYAWRTRETRYPSLVLAIFTMAGAVASSILLGVSGLVWMPVALLASFFLVRRSIAAPLGAAALLTLAVDGRAFDTRSHAASFLVTSTIVGAFAFIFSHRTELQRRRLEALSARDSLTGVGNRRSMEHELEIAAEASRRRGTSYGLIMLDLDEFKAVNDEYGHEAGDRVLAAFAALIQRSVRKIDRVFRFGGDELVVLLPGTGVEGLKTVASSLRAKVAAELIGPQGELRATLGAAALRPGESWQQWLARSDAALYRAKRRGRDRVEVDDSILAAP